MNSSTNLLLPCKPELALDSLLKLQEQRKQANKLKYYQPYSKQKLFHNDGIYFRERLFMAGNQLGKTWSGGFEAAIHATGIYPEWWEGKRFDKPTVGWTSGVTGEAVRDTVQRVLLGRPGQEGTGAIPASCIISKTSAMGVSEAVDTVKIRHVSGGVSTIAFKSYNRGREKWQGETLDWVWYDEEPPPDIYIEGLTRTNATGGIVWMTFTPLKGMSDVVCRFVLQESQDRHTITMTIDDVEHFDDEQKRKIIDSYPDHEKEARAKGIPSLGSGRVFPVAESDITIKPFDIPRHWPCIIGLDFGWDHPTAAAKIAWDRDSDTVYVIAIHRKKEDIPAMHAAVINSWGAYPVAWPHDGLQHDKGSGQTLAEIYRRHAVKMLPERATFTDGSSSVEAGIMDMLERMQTGRFKVFSHLEEWFEEFRLYHRDDGKIVKERDDLLCATRYGIMMLRFATTNAAQAPLKMDTSYIV